MNLCDALMEVRIRSTLIHFPFPLLPQGSCRYIWARLDLPREGNAFAVPKLPVESSSLGLARAVAKR